MGCAKLHILKLACIIAVILLPFSVVGGNYNYIILRTSIPLSKQIQNTHSIYVIRYDYNLNGKTLQIPFDCILKFEGGHITNGTICFNNTTIDCHYKDAFCHISVEGEIANNEVWLSWWKLAYDKEHNDAIQINQIIKSIDNCVFYFDIQHDIYVGGDKTEGIPGEIITFANKQNIRVIQPTSYYTVLKGSSKGGHVIGCFDNRYISIDGLKVDGANVYYHERGENGIGVTGNNKVLVENCIIKNCYSNCFDKNASGRLLSSGYPEWGSGGKGIQIEGGEVPTQVTIRNNCINDCYIGISNNASNQERINMDGNYIESCYMSIVLLRLGGTRRRMSVNISNTMISNNKGDVGAICMGNVSNVNMTNTQVKGYDKLKSLLRGCFSYSNIQIIVDQPCENLIDAALYRDNPEGEESLRNIIGIIAEKDCDYIVNTSSSVVPKINGRKYTNFVGGEFDITLPKIVCKTPIVLPEVNRSTRFNVKSGGIMKSGYMETINR